MFIDYAKIHIKSGDGGNGCVHFHREKYVMRGGPDGGDGGDGGDILFFVDESQNTLLQFKYRQHFRAENGGDGKGNDMSGKKGEALRIGVPRGTLIKDRDGRMIADMSRPGAEKTVLRGGRGGRGNARFATPTRQAPQFATSGEKTGEFDLALELKTVADVGLIGLPNVGKSTLLSVLTSAKPKIANYHFTTLAPNLGVARRYETTFTLADIPGLIEGAAEGAGLGHAFLRHVERTRALLHLVDISGSEGRSPMEDFLTVNAELASYDPALQAIPQLVVANKMDLTGSEENLAAFRSRFGGDYEILPVSAATHKGLEPLLDAITALLGTLPEKPLFNEEAALIREEERVSVDAVGGLFVVSGDAVDRLLMKTDPNSSESMRFFQQSLIRMGIIAALREKGAAEGSTIRMGEWEFDFVE